MKLRINKMRTTFENENCFSRNDTYVVKEIAIVAMVLHHVYPNSTGTPIYMLDNKDVIGFWPYLWKFALVLFISMGVSMLIEMMKVGLNINKYVIRIRKEFI